MSKKPASKKTAAKKAATNKRAPVPPKKKGLSARAQWGLIIGVGVLIIGVMVLNGIRDAVDDGGDGVVAAESFDLPALDDDDNPENRVRLSDFDGRPTVVNFFASWCATCDEELPAFRDAALALDGEVDFIFVNSQETGNWRPMAERNGIDDLIIAKDIKGIRRNGLYRSLGGPGGMPITAFYDADGNLVDTAFTAFSSSTLNRQLQALGFVS